MDVTNLVAGEHIAGRPLQIQNAVARDPRQPEFGALPLNYIDDLWDGLRAPTFEKYGAEEARADAKMAKSWRLRQEETVDDKKKEDEKDKEKGDPKGDGKGDAQA